MSNQEKNVLKQIIENEFSLFKFDYLLLREPENWSEVGDFDILVCNIDYASVTLNNLGYLEVYRDTSAKNKKFIKFFHNKKIWIHIDLHDSIDCSGIIWPKDFIRDLMHRAEKGSDNIIRAPKQEASLLYLFHAASEKNKIQSKYLHMIINIDLSLNSFYVFLPKPLEHYSILIENFKNKKINMIDLLNGFKEKMVLKKPTKLNIFIRFYNRLKSFYQYKTIVFLGPDGSGKSSIVDNLGSIKWPPTDIEYMGPARKKSMRNALFKSYQTLSKIRDRYKKTSVIGFIVRIVCLLICYFDFLDRYYRNIWKYGSNKRIIFDRYACDMYFRKPNFINENLFLKFFPKPYLIFLCVGDAQKIYNRKPEELSVNDIKDTIQLYRLKLKEYKMEYIEIDTTVLNQNDSLLYALEQIEMHKL
jgi:thymidylate kinase